jgi:hypothetical protein
MRLRGISGFFLAATALASALTGVTSLPALAAPGPSDPNSAPGTYRALTATRVLDTRYGVGAAREAVTAHGTVRLTLTGRGGLPSDGPSAVVLNVTETQATHSGYLTAYPDGLSRPVVSNVSFPAGQTVANLVTVRLGADGAVDLYNGTSGSVQIIADLRGYYLSGAAVDPGAFTPLAPARVLDTRSGHGPVAGRAVLPVQLTGVGGVPVSGVSSVVLNLTATQEQGSGYLTAYGDGSRPGTSNLNFTTGRTVANLVTVPLTSAGAVNVYVGSAASVELVVDVAGYFLTGSPAASGAVVPVVPTRLLDTRCGVSGGTCFRTIPGKYTENWPTMTVLGRAGVPSSGVAAVVFDLTATQANGPGFLTMTPADPRYSSSIPTTSDVNFPAGRTAANQVISPLDVHGDIAVYFGATHVSNVAVIVDVVGYVLAPRLDWSVPAAIDPQHGPSRVLSCPSATFCAGLDAEGDFRTFNGVTWSDPEPVPGLAASLLSCASSTSCVTIGGQGGAQMFATYDGHSWTTPRAVDAGFAISWLSCPTTTFCMALDNRSGELTLTGTDWSARVVADAAHPVSRLSCASSTFCAFEDANGAFRIWNGSSWANGTAPASPTFLEGLSCPGPAFCAATSNRSLLTYDGTSWTTTSPPNNGTFTSLDCASATRCAAVTSFGAATTWDGTSWQVPSVAAPPLPGDGGFGVVACGSTLACVAVTTGGRSVLFDGSTWSAAVPTQPANVVSSLSCPSSTFCLATDADGAVMTYDGTQWSSPTTVLSTHTVTHASCATSTFCMVVDGSGHVAGFDGSHWGAVADPDPGVALTGVSCPADGTCVAVDSAGAALTYSGTWSAPVVVTARAGLLAVSCAAVGSCLTVDGYGYAWRLAAGAWTTDDVSTGNEHVTVSCLTTTHCVVAYRTGSRTVDGTSWSPAQPTLTDGQGLSCASASFCLVVDDASAAFLGPAAWNATTGPFTNVTLTATAVTSCASDRFCVAVDQRGLASVGTA